MSELTVRQHIGYNLPPKMRELAEQMDEMGKTLELHTSFSEYVPARGRELRGAAAIVREWAANIAEDYTR